MYISTHAYCILQTISTGCKAYHNLVLNGTGPLKLLHLYGDFAIVVTTSNKLVAEPRQACMSPERAHTCLRYATIMYMYLQPNLLGCLSTCACACGSVGGALILACELSGC